MGRVTAMVDAEGRLVLPVEIRRSLGLEGGGELALSVENHVLRGSTRDAAVQRAQELVAGVVPPGVSLSEQLIAERRTEAMRDLNG